MYTKKELQKLVFQLCCSADEFYDEKSNRIQLPSQTIAHYGRDIGRFEMSARMMYGKGMLMQDAAYQQYVPEFNRWLLAGTDKRKEGYWGDFMGPSQICVELIPALLTMYLNKKATWDCYSEAEKKQITDWFLQVNLPKGCIQGFQNNWAFFRILVNTFLWKLGAEYDEKVIRTSQKTIEKCYLGNGWYSDGTDNYSDYYVAFAFHYYGLIYYHLRPEDAYARRYFDRAEQFAYQYMYWFSKDGDCVPYGRSLCYRFAQSAFWSAYVWAGGKTVGLGIAKGIIERNIRWWMEQEITDNRGLLNVGYAYENLIMSETYNGSGSPYWAFKTFLILALDNQHGYWTTEPQELPQLEKHCFIRETNTHICRNKEGTNVMLFPNSYNTGSLFDGGNFCAKYLKFAYSNRFGFSCQRDNSSIELGAYDSAIAFSKNDRHFVIRDKLEAVNTTEDVIYSKWKSDDGNITCESYVIPGVPWHVRAHVITVLSDQYVYDCGFSADRFERKRYIDEKRCYSWNEKNCVGAVNLCGDMLPRVIQNAPNTNLLYSLTDMPLLRKYLKKGTYLLINGFFGEEGKNCSIQQLKRTEPYIVEVEKGKYNVFLNGKEVNLQLGVRSRKVWNWKKTIRLFLLKYIS